MRTISHLYTHAEGIELDCVLEYDRGQTATEIDPPYPPAAYLMSAKIGTVDVLPLLDDELVTRIEESAIWSQE